MIGNCMEYLSANNKVIQIMRMIQGNPIFDDLKPIQSSDIVDLSLEVLRILIQIHDESSEDKQRSIRMIQDIAESSNCFIRFAEESRRIQIADNIYFMEVLSAIGKVEDRRALICDLTSRKREDEKYD